MTSSASTQETQYKFLDLHNLELSTNWEEVICPICLDFPHNSVLLECSSYDKGCRPFICDTDHTHSNCLERFKTAYGIPTSAKNPPIDDVPVESGQSFPLDGNQPTCPLCRGCVTGWIAVNEARLYFDMKRRCCEEKRCTFVGNYMELQKHAKLMHPHARPAEIDPARKVDWENFQQSSEVIDVLSTIHAEMPRGVVLGDYVIEYGDEDSVDEYEDLPRDKGNWWTSCILYQVFGNFRASRNRRRARAAQMRARLSRVYDDINLNQTSIPSVGVSDYRFNESEDDFMAVSAAAITSSSSSSRSSRRRRLVPITTRRSR